MLLLGLLIIKTKNTNKRNNISRTTAEGLLVRVQGVLARGWGFLFWVWVLLFGFGGSLSVLCCSLLLGFRISLLGLQRQSFLMAACLPRKLLGLRLPCRIPQNPKPHWGCGVGLNQDLRFCLSGLGSPCYGSFPKLVGPI